jgi:hypothetical protein
LQGPLAATFGRVAASQLDQARFDVSFDLDLVRPLRLWFVVQGRRKTGGDQTPPDTADRAEANPQSGDELVVGGLRTRGGVRQQEEAGLGELAGRPLPDGHQVFQRGSFRCRQGDSILVHRILRNAGEKECLSVTLRIANHLSIED